MWCEYDENLNENPFLNEIIDNHPDLIDKISEQSWILCVPRKGTLDYTDINQEQIWNHIIIPHQTPQTTHYSTLSQKTITLNNRQLNDNTNILFEETFYQKHLKYTVWCLDKPLFNPYPDLELFQDTLNNLQDCYDYLWCKDIDLDEIEKICDQFAEPQTDNLNELKSNMETLYKKCMTIANDSNEHTAKAVEVYMQSCLDDRLIRTLNTMLSTREAELNKIIRNAQTIDLNHMEIPIEYQDAIRAAGRELSHLNHHFTGLEKFNTLKTTYEHLSGNCDDLLQITIYLILKSDINTWLTNLYFLKELTLQQTEQTKFLITTLEASLEFIQNDQLIKSDRMDELPIFQMILEGNLDQFKELLQTDRLINLCHPLCICDKCLDYSGKKLDNPPINCWGEDLIICATRNNRRDFVEYLLLEMGYNVNRMDYKRRTALHHAAGRGYQDILLLLMGKIDNLNAKDSDGNTCLHLAADRGHENCVKAVIFSGDSLRINAMNHRNETALHLAARWGYLAIVQDLLDAGASPHVRDRQNRLPIELTTNNHILNLLKVHNDKMPIKSRIKPKSMDYHKKIDVLLKAIENNDLPLTTYYLGFSNNNLEIDWKNKCHPLCICEKCSDPDWINQSPTVEIGMNVNVSNQDGYTPLHMAAKCGRVEILRLLLDGQANLNAHTHKNHFTPLHLACVYQRVNVVKELIGCGSCNVNVIDAKGNTPLYYASMKNNVRIVEILLDNGADCNLTNFNGYTILQAVKDRELYKIEKLLRYRTDQLCCDDNLLF